MNHYTFEEIYIGQSINFTFEINEKKMLMFKEITGDVNPLHNDLDFAKSKGFTEKVVYGMLTSSVLSTLAGVYMPGEKSLIHEIEIKYLKPVFISDTPLEVYAEVEAKEERFKQITIKYIINNKKGEKVSKGKMKIGFTE